MWLVIRSLNKAVLVSTHSQGDSNEHPQRIFSWGNEENYPLIII